MRPIKNPQGFTLLELLISVAISSIILLTLASLFKGQGQTYKAQDQLTIAGQRTRLAIDNFARELGFAGYGLPVITTSISANRSAGGTDIYLPNTSGYNEDDTIYLCGNGICESATISSTDPQEATKLTISAGLTNPFSAGDTIYTIKDDRSGLTLEGIVDTTYDSGAFNNAYFATVWGSRNIFDEALDATENTISFFANIEQITTTLSESVTAGETVLPAADNVDALNEKDLVFISDGGNSESAAVSSSSSAGSPPVYTLTLASGGLANSYPIGSTISNADLIVYEYDSGAKTLRRSINGGNFDPFVENIDYFQLRYFDGNGDPIPSPVPNPYKDFSLSAEERAAVRQINIQIVAMTTIDDPLYTSSGTYGDGTVYNDGRHRVTLETNLFMRNLVQ